MKRILLFVMVFGVASTCFAKAYYAGKMEMIQKAECIAIVKITKIEKADKKGKGWTYRQKATATVERCLKGDAKGEIEIYGMETFICAQCRYEKGRFILFLRKENGFWVGSNWQLGIRPIKKDKVQWFIDNKTRHEMKEAPLDDVISEITDIVGEQKRETRLSQVATGLSKIAEGLKPVAAVEQNGRAVSMSYNTRKFMVHSSDKLGRRSKEAHEAVGPRYDGIIVQVTVQDGRYASAAKIPQDLRRPYWTTFVNAYPISKGKQHLHVNISYGSRTDRKVITQIKNLLESMVDDDPKVKTKEPEAHNKAIDSDKK